MGLDNFASRIPDDLILTEDDLKAFEEASIDLCGGILSGEGSSFRGKVYSALIEKVTGISLYDEWIPPETVKSMSEILSKYTAEELFMIINKVSAYDIHTEKTMASLQRFFQICAKRGLGIIGWS